MVVVEGLAVGCEGLLEQDARRRWIAEVLEQQGEVVAAGRDPGVVVAEGLAVGSEGLFDEDARRGAGRRGRGAARRGCCGPLRPWMVVAKVLSSDARACSNR